MILQVKIIFLIYYIKKCFLKKIIVLNIDSSEIISTNSKKMSLISKSNVNNSGKLSLEIFINSKLINKGKSHISQILDSFINSEEVILNKCENSNFNLISFSKILTTKFSNFSKISRCNFKNIEKSQFENIQNSEVISCKNCNFFSIFYSFLNGKSSQLNNIKNCKKIKAIESILENINNCEILAVNSNIKVN